MVLETSVYSPFDHLTRLIAPRIFCCGDYSSSERRDPLVRRHFPEDRNPHQHLCKKVMSRKVRSRSYKGMELGTSAEIRITCTYVHSSKYLNIIFPSHRRRIAYQLNIIWLMFREIIPVYSDNI
jgi:hypothetical protein